MTLAGRLAATPGGDGRQLRGKARGAGAEPAVMCPAAQAAIRRARAAPVPGGPSACGSLTPAGPRRAQPSRRRPRHRRGKSPVVLGAFTFPQCGSVLRAYRVPSTGHAA